MGVDWKIWLTQKSISLRLYMHIYICSDMQWDIKLMSDWFCDSHQLWQQFRTTGDKWIVFLLTSTVKEKYSYPTFANICRRNTWPYFAVTQQSEHNCHDTHPYNVLLLCYSSLRGEQSKLKRSPLTSPTAIVIWNYKVSLFKKTKQKTNK